MQHFCEIYLYVIGHCGVMGWKSSLIVWFQNKNECQKNTNKTHPINECDILQRYSKISNTRLAYLKFENKMAYDLKSNTIPIEMGSDIKHEKYVCLCVCVYIVYKGNVHTECFIRKINRYQLRTNLRIAFKPYSWKPFRKSLTSIGARLLFASCMIRSVWTTCVKIHLRLVSDIWTFYFFFYIFRMVKWKFQWLPDFGVKSLWATHTPAHSSVFIVGFV